MSFSGSTFGRYTKRALVITGVFMLALGGAFVVMAGSIPVVGGAFMLVAGIFGLIGVVLIVVGVLAGRSAEATERVLQSGIAGHAQITGMTQTGMYLNENPQISMNLLVSLPGHAPYAAVRREFVPLMLLGRLTSGAPLAVRVDPADMSKIVIDWGTSGFVASPTFGALPGMDAGALPGMQPGAAPMQPSAAALPPVGAAVPAGLPSSGSGMDESLGQIAAAMQRGSSPVAAPYANPAQSGYTVEQLRAYLRQNGIQASARVDRLVDSGSIVGDERLYTMELTLDLPGTGVQKLPASAAMVPISVSHRLFQGMTVPVRYAAENPNLLMVEWDRL